MLTVFPGYLLTSRTTWIVVLRIVPESLQASICGIQTLSSGDSIWLMALTDDDGELHQVDIPSQAGCSKSGGYSESTERRTSHWARPESHQSKPEADSWAETKRIAVGSKAPE